MNSQIDKRIPKISLHSLFPVLLIIPALIPLFIFIVLPGAKTLLDSFYEITFGLPRQYIGFDNYTSIGTDSVFWSSLGNTIMFSFAVVAGEILLGLIAALIMGAQKNFKKLLVSLIMIPYAVSDVVAVIIWKYMLDPDVGIVNYLFHILLGFDQIEWASNPAQAWVVIILIRIWTDFLSVS